MRVTGKDLSLLAVVLLISLVHGMLYVYLVPPWQHSDEPNHFEYAWLLANRPGWPQAGDYDAEMRRDVAESMIENGFFRGMGFVPDLTDSDQPVWIGQYAQLGQSPVYYLMISLPLRILRNASIEDQLYATRLVSLAMLVLTILAAWGTVCELTPNRDPLRFLFPVLLALLPGFVDIMTAVNNDTGAIMMFTFSFWGMTAMLRRPGAAWIAILSSLAMVLAIATKETAYVGGLVYSVVLLLWLLRGKLRRIAWMLSGLAAVVVFFSVYTWGDAALWGRITYQSATTREASLQAPAGEYAIRMDIISEPAVARNNRLHQLLPLTAIDQLRGKTVTLGAWVWASEPVQIDAPALTIFDGHHNFTASVQASTTPRFIAIEVEVPEESNRIWVSLNPVSKPGDTPVTVYYDGIVLVEGKFAGSGEPSFDNIDAIAGTWGDKRFTNVVRNGSGERAWFHVRSWADRVGARLLPDETTPAWMTATIWDRQGVGWLYEMTAQRLFKTFWGMPGWNHIELPGQATYAVLGMFTLLGIIGFAWLSWVKRWWSADLVILFGLTIVVVWGAAMLRGSLYVLYNLYIPGARYAYPALVATFLPLCAGWLYVATALLGGRRFPTWVPSSILIGMMLVLDYMMITRVINYYYMTNL